MFFVDKVFILRYNRLRSCSDSDILIRFFERHDKKMSNLTKRIVSLALSGIMILSLGGCYSESKLWAAKKGDVTLHTGGYIYYLYNSFFEAAYKVSTEKKVLSTTIEDKKAETWIKDKAMDNVKEYFYLEDKFAELGLELTDEDLEDIDSTASYYWDTYGQKATLEGLGISQASFVEVTARASTLYSKIFEATYAPGGEKEVSDENLKAYYEENYFSYELFYAPLSTTDEEGNTTDLTDEEKSALLKTMEGYAKKVKDGDLTMTEAATEYAAESGAGSSTYSNTAEAIADASTTLQTETIALADNEVKLIDGGSMYAVVKRLPISDKTAGVLESEAERGTIVSAWKSEEFRTSVDEAAAAVTGIELNNSAINSYSIKRFVTDQNEMGYSSLPSESSSIEESSEAESSGTESDVTESSASSEASESSAA